MLRRFPIAGLALTGLFVFGQASTFIHELMVRHVVCPTHGELVHADETVRTAAIGEGEGLEAAPPADSEHSHEHCLILTRGRSASFAPPTRSVAVQQAIAHPGARPDRPTFFEATVALLRLAPKSSPPA